MHTAVIIVVAIQHSPQAGQILHALCVTGACTCSRINDFRLTIKQVLNFTLLQNS